MLRFFDPNELASITYGNLPHWFQPGCVVFSTFRLHDSVPGAVMRRYQADRLRWLQLETRRPDVRSIDVLLGALTPDQRRAFDRHFAAVFNGLLDRGYGECQLRDPAVARIVADRLAHFDGERYELADFVVMPNHVHVLMGLIGEHDAPTICESWKRFAATEINRHLGRSGRLWQPEAWDHLVRGGDRFDGYRRYIHRNPEVAGLREGEYLLGCGNAFAHPLP